MIRRGADAAAFFIFGTRHMDMIGNSSDVTVRTLVDLRNVRLMLAAGCILVIHCAMTGIFFVLCKMLNGMIFIVKQLVHGVQTRGGQDIQQHKHQHARKSQERKSGVC